MQGLDKIWEKKRLQKFPTVQVIAIFARSPKPAFSETVQRTGQAKCFKNRPKSSPCLKDLKALAQMPLSSNLTALKVQRLENI